MTTEPNKDALREAVGNIMRIARGASNPALELLADRICALPTIALLDEVEAVLGPFAEAFSEARQVSMDDIGHLRRARGRTALQDFRNAHKLLAKIQQARGDRG